MIVTLTHAVLHCALQRTGETRVDVEARARLDLAHEQAMRREFPQVVSALRNVLGARLVAYLGEVQETSAVDGWADGNLEPSATIQVRLRVALEAALLVEGADGRRVAQAWFQGLSPQLDDCSPVWALRESDLEVGREAVLGAARAFLAG